MNAFQKLGLWLGWCQNATTLNKKEENILYRMEENMALS
jgi:hypothetical protein